MARLVDLPDHRPVRDKDAALVQRMFDRVAPRYDVANTVFSFGLDRHWRAVTVDAIAPRPASRSAVGPLSRMTIVDVAGGTGALAALLAARGAQVVVADLSFEMIRVGTQRVAYPVRWTVADALRLPFADASVDAVTIAFGLRNLNDTHAGLAEFLRVVRPGGQLAVLEFSQPLRPAFRALYHRYLLGALPHAARVFTSAPAAYGYLARSIAAWPDQHQLAAIMGRSGWEQVRWKNLSGGIVALHHAVRPK
jgi:demethylmenaquinone methyltransferase / 2-methoxy-6-polyprenyl-1,4-benzoquinol methylase